MKRFLVPIFLLLFGYGFYHYKFVSFPDGLRNGKGEAYDGDFIWTVLSDKFTKKCLEYSEDKSDILFGSKQTRFAYNPLDESTGFPYQKITLRSFGVLKNLCSHNVSITSLPFTNKLSGEKEKSKLWNEYPRYSKDSYGPTNNIYFPDGDELGANSSIKIELVSTDLFQIESERNFLNDRLVPKKTDVVEFNLDLNFPLSGIDINERTSTLDLAKEGLIRGALYVKNPHGERLLSFDNDGCELFRLGSKIDIFNSFVHGACTKKRWQIISRITNKPISNVLEFAENFEYKGE